MKKLRPPKTSNARVLRVLKDSRPDIRHLIPSIKQAYIKYLNQKANPTSVLPLKIEAPFDVELTNLYGGAAKKHGLDWIKSLRENTSLVYCPMCGNQGNSDIEHYLPKSNYPEFSFLSFNLIPSCTDCNRKRGVHASSAKNPKSLLHPYFDGDILNTPLVVVRIFGEKSADGRISFSAPEFKMESLLAPENALSSRLEYHLEKCINDAVFNRFVGGHWVFWRRKAIRSSSLEALKEKIEEELEDYEATAGLNSWSSAFFRGLLRDDVALNWLKDNPCA